MAASRRKIRAGIPFAADAPLFPSPLVSERENTEGMAYAMVYRPRVNGAPTVPLPTRSSLGQPVARYRNQISVYLSRYRTGLQGYIGYPAARGQQILNTAPPLARKPAPTSNGVAVSKPGTMGSPKRFRKALPLPINNFNPPVY